MCRSLIFNAYLVGMCIFQHILKMTTILHHCCVMYKKNSGMQNQLRVTTYMHYKLDICIYRYIASALLSKCKKLSAVQILHRTQAHVSSVLRHCVHQLFESNWRRDRNSV